MTTQGGDAFASGYSLGGDPHQLGIVSRDEAREQAAVRAVVCREDMSPEERRQVLEALGLTEVATRLAQRGRDGAA